LPDFTIRPLADDADRAFAREMNGRLTGVIAAPAHSGEDVAAFQDRFTASAWQPEGGAGATFVAADADGRRLGYVNVREGLDELADEKCGYVALLAVAADAEGTGVGQALVREAERWAGEMGYSRLALDVFATRGGDFSTRRPASDPKLSD